MTIHPSVILWLSVLYYLSPQIVLPFLAASMLHEFGHAITLFFQKTPPRHITITFSGALMDTPALSYRQELLAATGGPLVSLLSVFLTPVFPALGFYSLCLGLINLLPIAGLDGSRILRCIFRLHFSAETSERAEKTVGIAAGGLLLLGGMLLTLCGDLGLWPLFFAAGLLLRAVKTA